MTKIEIISTIPRCGCQKIADFMVTNRETGDKRYFCRLCGAVHVLSYHNESWEIKKLR